MPHDELVRIDKLSARLDVNPTTLRRWRASGVGPAFIQLGPKIIAYREADIAAWIEQRRNTEARPTR
jgi:predicted DNA-binding transcriptional regulator AlpA